MSEIYYVRHGETEANAQCLMSGGEWDVQLNEAGLMQAEQARNTLADLRINTICSSPLIRARKTAEIINHDRLIPVAIVPDLREWDLGSWSRQTFDVAGASFFDGDPPGGETRAAFFERVLAGFQESLTHPRPVLIVAHGAVWRSLQEQLRISSDWIPNCEPHQFHEISGKWFSEKVLTERESNLGQ